MNFQSAPKYQQKTMDKLFKTIKEQDYSYDVTDLTTCMELLKTKEAMFIGEEGESFVKLGKAMLSFYYNNFQYLQDIIQKDREEDQAAQKDIDDFLDNYINSPATDLKNDDTCDIFEKPPNQMTNSSEINMKDTMAHKGKQETVEDEMAKVPKRRKFSEMVIDELPKERSKKQYHPKN